MPRNTLLLAILASSVIFLIGAMPGTASAANCTNPVIGNTYYGGGLWHFQTQLQNCTDVDYVEFSRTNTTAGPYQGAGWVNMSNTCCGPHVAPPGYNPDVVSCGRIGVSFTDSCVVTYNIPPFCGVYGYGPGTVFVAKQYRTYRIHSRAQNSWGPWHQGYVTNNIGC